MAIVRRTSVDEYSLDRNNFYSAVRKAFLNFGSVRFGFAAKTAVFGSVRFSKNNRGSGRFGSVFRDVSYHKNSFQTMHIIDVG